MERVTMLRRTRAGLGVALAGLCTLALAPALAQADVTAVSGGAYGYSLNVSLFGTAQPQVGPTPSVVLPAGGSVVPVTANATTGSATAGAATFFSSGPIAVSTQGTPGPTGSVTSSTSLQAVGTSGDEPFTATSISSTCTAAAAGASASTTIAGGMLVTDNGQDLNADGDYTDASEHAPVVVAVPANPAPNTVISGHTHLSITSTDFFSYVFNEQIVNPDGSITVNAAHEYLLGPTAVGDVIVGQSVCGVTAARPRDTTKPVLSSLSVSPARLHAASADRGTSIAAPRASMVSYRLSEPAVVSLRDERAVPGRRVRGRCVKPKRSNLGARRCRRYVLLRGGSRHQGKRGRNRFKYTGRLYGRKLAPGSYRLRAIAKDPAGNKSRTKRARFRILR